LAGSAALVSGAIESCGSIPYAAGLNKAQTLVITAEGPHDCHAAPERALSARSAGCKTGLETAGEVPRPMSVVRMSIVNIAS
jgi:hypothetical protein